MNEREIEIPWAIKHAVAPVLDVGWVESTYLKDLPQPVDGIDIRPPLTKDVPLRAFIVGDIRGRPLMEQYATVLAISTVEHVGLASYSATDDDPENGDAEAVKGCYQNVAPGGKLLISVPFGAPRDYGWFRQYDLDRLVRLCGDLNFSADIWAMRDGQWTEAESLEEVEHAERLEYDHGAGSARAVALITINKPCV